MADLRAFFGGRPKPAPQAPGAGQAPGQPQLGADDMAIVDSDSENEKNKLGADGKPVAAGR